MDGKCRKNQPELPELPDVADTNAYTPEEIKGTTRALSRTQPIPSDAGIPISPHQIANCDGLVANAVEEAMPSLVRRSARLREKKERYRQSARL